MTTALELKVIFAAVDKFSASAKAINKVSGALAKELKATKDAFKELEKQQGLVDAFRSTNKALGITGNDLKTARERVEQMAKAMQAGVPTTKMQRDFKTATEEARHLAAQVNRLAEKKQRLRGELSAVGIDTKKLSEHQRNLKGQMSEATAAVDKQTEAIEKHNKMQQQMRTMRADFDSAKQRAGKLAGFGAKAIAGGGAINAAAAIPVVAYANAEDAQTQLRIAMMQKGGQVSDQFKEIDALAAQLGNKLPGTTADFQNMMTMLIRQGMPAESLLGGLGKATAYLAVQLKMAPEAAAEFSSKLQDATRTTSQDMMGLMDTIQRMFYLGVDQNNMLEAFKGLGPAMDLIKRQGLEGTKALAPFVVMMDQAGMRGESAGNAIRKVIASGLNVDKIKIIQDDLKKSKGISLNLDFTDGKGEFGGIEKLMSELNKLKKFDTVTRLAILKDIYGDDKENNEVLSKIIEKGTAGYDEVQAKMANQANIQERVNAQLGTLKSLWDAATGTFTNALVAFGESISPELHATAEWLGEVAERTQAWAKENPELSNTIMSIVKWAGLAAIIIGGLSLAASTIIVPLAIMKASMVQLGLSGNPLIAGMGTVASKILGVVSPVGKLVAAFGLGYAAGTLLNDGLDWMISKLAGYETSLGGFIFDVVQKFKAAPWSEIGGWIIKGIEVGLDSLTLGLYSKVKDLAAGIAKAAREALGIKSPSRIFAEIGNYTMQGLQRGLQGGEDGPLSAISATAKKLAAIGAGITLGASGGAFANQTSAVESPVNKPLPAVTASAPGGNTYHITIQAPAGIDNQGLASLVAREIERIEAGKAAQRRSRLRDTE